MGVTHCSDDGSELVIMPANEEMLQSSEGYQRLAKAWVRIKGVPIPVDDVQVGLCPHDGCHNTYFWVNDDYPRIGVYPADE